MTDGQSSPVGIAGNLYFYDHASNGHTPTTTLEKDLCTREKVQFCNSSFLQLLLNIAIREDLTM